MPNALTATPSCAQHFLEDAYEFTGYVLDADAPAAMRPNKNRSTQKRLAKAAGNAAKQKLVSAGDS